MCRLDICDQYFDVSFRISDAVHTYSTEYARHSAGPTNWPANGTVDVGRERHGSQYVLPVMID